MCATVPPRKKTRFGNMGPMSCHAVLRLVPNLKAKLTNGKGFLSWMMGSPKNPLRMDKMGGKKSPSPSVQVQKMVGFGVPGPNIYTFLWGVSFFSWHVSCERENLRLRALLSDGHGAERQFWTPRVSYLHGTGLVHALFTCFGTGVGILQCFITLLS